MLIFLMTPAEWQLSSAFKGWLGKQGRFRVLKEDTRQEHTAGVTTRSVDLTHKCKWQNWPESAIQHRSASLSHLHYFYSCVHLQLASTCTSTTANLGKGGLTLFLVKFRSKSSKRRLRGSKPGTVSANCPTTSRLARLLSPQPCCRWPVRVWQLTPLRFPRLSRRRPAPQSRLWRARKWCSGYDRRLDDGRCRYRKLDVSTETDNQISRSVVELFSQISRNMTGINHFGATATSRRSDCT